MKEHALHAHRHPICYDAEIEQMAPHRLAALQATRLADTVERARHAPFFRERLAALDEHVERLAPERFQECVPLTSKQDLREARESAWVQDTTVRPSLMLATSGTTGTRVALPYSNADLQRWRALVARTLWTNGLRPDDAVLLPVPLGLFTGGHGMFGGLQQLGCRTVPLGAVNTPGMIEALRGAFGALPTAIVGLPSHLLRLLDSLPAAGYDPAASPLRIGSLGAEAWSNAARRRIEEGFGMQAVDSYGIGEICGPGIAAECEERDGMHLWEDAFFAEIVDPTTGEPLPDGTPGELVVTPLFRELFPLLRYRTGDEAALIAEACPCGRTHRRISRIARRLDDVLVITGVNIDAGDIERILFDFPWLSSEFYLSAGDDRAGLHIHVERRAEVPAPTDAETQITEAIRRDFHVRVAVHLYDAGQLERLPGKAKRIR